MLSLPDSPKDHQTIAQGRCRNVFDAVTVTGVIILKIGKDYIHSQACCLQGLPYTPFELAISI